MDWRLRVCGHGEVGGCGIAYHLTARHRSGATRQLRQHDQEERRNFPWATTPAAAAAVGSVDECSLPVPPLLLAVVLLLLLLGAAPHQGGWCRHGGHETLQAETDEYSYKYEEPE
eukprot:GHVU01180768.1.p2 GENE.GHVU01180768.1~~GHVU01180768.1.p2  ORF type:complete len:115 (-),score=26.12 GHVU01180768.1:85-429(-)